VQADERVSDKDWARREGMISFAGYPLLVEGRTVGVIAMFARESLELDTIEALESVAPIIAQGVERKRTQDTLRETQAELAHLNRVMTVGELTASIAHEINQPLAAIVMNGNAALRWLALDPPNLAKARDSAELIIRDGERASQVIARIRALLKKSPPAKTLLDVNEFVNEVAGLTQSEMVRNSVRLRVDLADYLPGVPGDRIQLQQVLLNLIVNAVEAMLTIEDRQRALLIATDLFDNTGVRVAVSDNGLGIDPQTADHLFDAFSTTKPQGMGMGLAISRSIIQAHGGRLWTEANDEFGATFQFTLPIVASES
jgi:C4-dicarboxylate-specific signal transduction histidine kinase